MPFKRCEKVLFAYIIDRTFRPFDLQGSKKASFESCIVAYQMSLSIEQCYRMVKLRHLNFFVLFGNSTNDFNLPNSSFWRLKAHFMGSPISNCTISDDHFPSYQSFTQISLQEKINLLQSLTNPQGPQIDLPEALCRLQSLYFSLSICFVAL